MSKNIPVLIARILLGLIYFVFGLNFFLHFAPVPPMPQAAGAFIGALVGSGYLFTVVKVTEIVGGAMLLSGKLVPFALTILAAITLNIFLFHTILTPVNPIAIVMFLLHGFLAWSYRANFKSVLEVSAQPTATQA